MATIFVDRKILTWDRSAYEIPDDKVVEFLTAVENGTYEELYKAKGSILQEDFIEQIVPTTTLEDLEIHHFVEVYDSEDEDIRLYP